MLRDRPRLDRRRLPAIAAGVVLGVAPVIGLAVVGGFDGGSATSDGDGDAVDGDTALVRADVVAGVSDDDPASIAIPLPQPASVADAPRPPALEPVSTVGRDSGDRVIASNATWYSEPPARRSVAPQMVPVELRDVVDVVPASVRVVGIDDVTISFRTESGGTGHAVGAGSIEDAVVPLFFLADRDETIHVMVSSVRGESVIGSIALSDVVSAGGLDVTGSELGSIEVATMDRDEMAERLGVDELGLDDYRAQHLTL